MIFGRLVSIRRSKVLDAGIGLARDRPRTEAAMRASLSTCPRQHDRGQLDLGTGERLERSESVATSTSLAGNQPRRVG